MYLENAVKSPTDPNGETLSTFSAIVFVVFATYGNDVKPIDTAPTHLVECIAAFPYSGAVDGTVCKAIATF